MANDPVLYRTPIIDPKTGGMSREWIRYFNQFSNTTYTNSIFFKAPNFIKFLNNSANADDGKIGNSLFAQGLNVIGINNDSTARKIQIWGGVTQNENVLGNTWAGKNTFSDSTNLVFGSGWQTWSPSYGSAGGMTVTQTALYTAQYIRVGPLVFVQFYATVTLSGVAATDIIVTLPIASSASISLQTMSATIAPGGTIATTLGRVNPATFPSYFSIYQPGGGNFVLGATDISFTGVYRVA